MTRALVALCLLGVILAGCSDPTAEGPRGSGAQMHAVQGVVVDAAIRPLSGVIVTIPARPEVQPVTTGIDGTFLFHDLSPGVIVLLLDKPGFLSSTVQIDVQPGLPVVKIQLDALEESNPYAVLESFRGHVECGVGSAPVAGLSAGCSVLLGSALYVLCTGSGPVPPTGICIGGTNPYFVSIAAGNMTVAQTEVVWQATVNGMSELLVGSYVVDRDGVVVAGVPGASGHSVLVRRLNATTVDEFDLGRTQHLAIYVNPGNTAPVNVVVQQSYEVYHTSTFLFEPDASWVFARDGDVPVPPACTSCLQD